MTSATGSRLAIGGGIAWLAGATLLGVTGALAALRPPGPQLLILGITVVALAVAHIGAVRTRIDALPVRWLVGLHAVRLVGIVFLALAAGGELSPLFAERAGWGDIAAAVLALGLVVSGPPDTRVRWWSYLVWNVFGLVDLVVAVGTATLVVMRGDVPGMDPLLRLPLIYVPMLLVPLLVTVHVILFRRLLSGLRSDG
ncbi:MAG: hypothetical protein L0271_15440 [Gemmatimonadetes bacterium]|nr:hypothetical protein [Gemmatimonadota bacterium]